MTDPKSSIDTQTPVVLSPAPEHAKDFVPISILDRALAGWWLVVLLTLAGSLTAWFIHFLQPPLYDAQAVIAGSINFSQTGVLPELELDYALNSLGHVIESTSVQEKTLAEAQARQIQLGSYQFRPSIERKATMERNATRWIMRVRHTDPQVAADLVNVWAEVAFQHITTAHAHALRAQSLQNYLNSLETCLIRAQTPAIGSIPCATTDPTMIQNEMARINAEMGTEVTASQGLVASLVFNFEQRASVPNQPARYGLNSMLLAGSLIGFLMGVWAVQTSLPARLARLRRRA